MRWAVLLSLATAGGLAACSGSGGDPTCASAAQVKLSDIQVSIITPTCAIPACHSGGAPAEGLNLEAGQTYASTVSVKSMLDSSKFLVDPMDAADSELYIQVSQQLMPQTGTKLTTDQLQQIHDWICVGAPNN